MSRVPPRRTRARYRTSCHTVQANVSWWQYVMSICFQFWRITQPLRIRKLARVGLLNPGWKQILRTSATNYLTNFKRDLATSFQMTLLFQIVGPSKTVIWYELRYVVYVELRFYRLRYIISYECEVKLKFTSEFSTLPTTLVTLG